jgi:hypothetical protein
LPAKNDNAVFLVHRVDYFAGKPRSNSYLMRACPPAKKEEAPMLRIRGTVGDWPVDLTLELDEGDWAQLGAQLKAAKPEVAAAVVSKPVTQDDKVWQIALDLLRKAGQMSGPELLDQLEGLTGSTASGKRLLVRLRHSSQVKVESGQDAPLYSWVNPDA